MSSVTVFYYNFSFNFLYTHVCTDEAGGQRDVSAMEYVISSLGRRYG